jgi:DNA-binding transcriptional LysR family regulator
MAVLIPPLLRRLRAEAPGVDLTITPIPGELDGALESGPLDAVIAPRRKSSPGLVWTRLFGERNVCLVRKDHPAVGRTLSLEAYCALPHVVVSPEGRGSAVDEALRRRGLRRRVALRVPSFLFAPLVVAETDLVATTAARVARRFAEVLPLRVLEPPLPQPEFALALGWHERLRQDPAHAWFRRLVAEVARELG